MDCKCPGVRYRETLFYAHPQQGVLHTLSSSFSEPHSVRTMSLSLLSKLLKTDNIHVHHAHQSPHTRHSVRTPQRWSIPPIRKLTDTLPIAVIAVV